MRLGRCPGSAIDSGAPSGPCRHAREMSFTRRGDGYISNRWVLLERRVRETEWRAVGDFGTEREAVTAMLKIPAAPCDYAIERRKGFSARPAAEARESRKAA